MKPIQITILACLMLGLLASPALAIHGISLSVFPSVITPGQTVQAYGYIDGDVTQNTRVYIYLDNELVKSVQPDTQGYYTTKLTITEEGEHTITARVYGEKAHARITVIPETQKETKIEIIEPASQKEKEYPFVTVDVSVKDLDVKRYGGNVVLVTITNHLGRQELFEVRTTFPDEMFFAPHQEVLEDGETKVFPLYFNPREEPGVYEGFVIVQAGDDIIASKKIRVSILNPLQAQEEKAMGLITPSWVFMGVAGMLVFLLVFLSIVREDESRGSRTPIPVNNSNIPTWKPPREAKPVAKKNETPKKKGIERSLGRLKRVVEDTKTERIIDKYVVPWNHVKM